MKRLTILGSTGSIGTSALDLVSRHPDRFCVTALAAGRNGTLLEQQIREFSPKIVSLVTEEDAKDLRTRLGSLPVEVTWGKQGLLDVARYSDADMVLSTLVGIAGLAPTLASMETGKTIALANKEALVTGGALVMGLAKEKDIPVLPVDSEHSAVFQCLNGRPESQVRQIWLTASGGPFLDFSPEELVNITPEQAINHPNWSMGPKISIDSATMMNKGLEVIEAKWLFDMEPDRIRVVIHPESVVHALVEFTDGQLLAQMSMPDMRGPISYALCYPGRLEDSVQPLDLAAISKLTFRKAGTENCPALALAHQTLQTGGTAPAILNAANEVAVGAFLKKMIRFSDIIELVSEVLDRLPVQDAGSLEAVLEADRKARETAEEIALSKAF